MSYVLTFIYPSQQLQIGHGCVWSLKYFSLQVDLDIDILTRYKKNHTFTIIRS